MTYSEDDFRQRVQRVMERIENSCDAVDRSPGSVQVIGVTKTVDSGAVSPLLAAGIRHFGENRWQHAREMLQGPRSDEVTWHFIGHLQTNKVKYIVPSFAWIHSVDSSEVASEISKYAVRHGTSVNCLVQVNVSGEETKSGIAAHDVCPFMRTVCTLPGIAWRGLMTMAPRGESEEGLRTLFGQLRRLRAEVTQELPELAFTELSMGMSDDFEVAIEEGATMVRLGRVLMGS